MTKTFKYTVKLSYLTALILGFLYTMSYLTVSAAIPLGADFGKNNDHFVPKPDRPDMAITYPKAGTKITQNSSATIAWNFQAQYDDLEGPYLLDIKLIDSNGYIQTIREDYPLTKGSVTWFAGVAPREYRIQACIKQTGQCFWNNRTFEVTWTGQQNPNEPPALPTNPTSPPPTNPQTPSKPNKPRVPNVPSNIRNYDGEGMYYRYPPYYIYDGRHWRMYQPR